MADLNGMDDLGAVTFTCANGTSVSGKGAFMADAGKVFVAVESGAIPNFASGELANLRCADGTGWDNLDLTDYGGIEGEWNYGFSTTGATKV